MTPVNPPYSVGVRVPSCLTDPLATFGTIKVVFANSDQGPCDVGSKDVMSKLCPCIPKAARDEVSRVSLKYEGVFMEVDRVQG